MGRTVGMICGFVKESQEKTSLAKKFKPEEKKGFPERNRDDKRYLRSRRSQDRD